MLALAAAFACTPKEEVIASLNVSRPAVEVPAAGGKVSVEITSNVAWTASADKDWVSEITPSNGQASDKPATVEIVITANDGEEREATVTFTAGTASKTMIITQVGAIKEEEPEDEVIPDHRLYVAWTFTTAWKATHEKTFSDSADKNELAAGDGGRYIPANAGGEGKLSYVQVDKSQFAAAPKIWRGAEKAIGKNGVSADLRFGHDTGLAPLLALLNVNGFGETAGSDDKIYETWADFIVTPMGSNIQFIFYRHAKTGAIIVKVLHNEKESTLPIKTDIFPYYHWEDVSSYFDSLIK